MSLGVKVTAALSLILASLASGASVSQMFRYKLKAIEAHKAWMKSPEVLENCSTGLHFPAEQIENSEEQEVIPLKSVAFYAADGSIITVYTVWAFCFQVLEKADSCNDLMTWHSYATIGKVLMQSGMEERALQAFQESEKKIAKKSNRVAYGFLLTMYADLGMNSEVDRIWDVYKSKVPASACNSMYMCRISVLLKMNDIVGAEKAYEEWESKHVYHDSRLINLLLTAYCKEGLMEKAEALVDQFVKKGRTPFGNTWYKLAGGYFKVGQASKAADLTKKALASASNEWIPDLTNVLMSLNYFAEQKNVEAAEEMMSLLQRLVTPTRDIYHGLLKTYVNAGKPVSDLLRRMKKDGMEADEETEKILAGEVH
ncbi:hypothetical protein OsI_34208 [Oryza sativa Indica Group]|uniref:Uncharacterized protein n=1 Tax=Oryza sativa subsp. indica TaxID=39946 RepID=A2Z917_ORYSI|nr:hypothetical protein OsI_34208 [Oryza sativa Indica Group]